MKKFFKTFGTVVLLTTALFSYTACRGDSDDSDNKTYYSVVFDTKGGSSVATQKVEAGKTAEKPDTPTKTSDTGKNCFGGWYSDENLTVKYDFSTPVTKDTVLYAKWAEVPEGSFLVSFDTNGGSKIEDQIVKEGEKASEPEINPVKTGVAFSHWYVSDPAAEYDFETAVTDTVLLKAKWNESGIYEADYSSESLYCINLYDSLEADSESGAW